ncbi:OmpH family outer membrane protein [Aureitalea sp. L0-47]|uniref:OmpH family outer membrane protein n=1 Tax=Aureitalea sp. L0-47 TaxID=2816962 RepID=UPI00223883A8|nr:OmpH family outer membrane protein [Aureitalea sp. L0-47]MCW5519416.1 OmpH family outer membrane protein [Aureitalea sp. L0-47]
MKQKIYILGLLLVIGMVSAVDAQTKMGYTNVELLMAYMPEVKSVENKLSNFEASLTQKLQVKQTNYQSKLQEYSKKKESGLSADEDQRRVAEIQRLEEEIQKEAQEAEFKLLRKREELLAPITNRIQEKIDEVAREGNFTYIINNSSGNGVPTILYGMETMNVTDELAAKLGISIE